MSQLVLVYKIERVLAFSTTTPLGANAVYTSPTIDGINYKYFFCRGFSNVAGSFVVEYSDDGVTWDASSSSAASANTLFTSAANPYGLYWRFIYTNGAAAQTVFRLGGNLCPL